MKKTKIIIPALGMLLLSTAASITGTVAWFSMNNFVTATSMNIKAKAENGIVISNNTGNPVKWADEAEAAHSAAVAVYPTSTATGAAWAHSASNDADDATSNGKYSMLTLENDSATGAGFVDKDDDNQYDATASQGHQVDDAYYIVNSFYIKSSAEAIEKTIYITSVKAEVKNPNDAASASADLNKSLRVLVRLSSDATTAKVFAPFSGATLSYNAATAVTEDNPATTDTNEYNVTKTAVTAIDASGSTALNTSFLANHSIPAYTTDSPVRIDIYLYFEGEDANCKSTNLRATLDNLEVEVKFGTQTA